MLERGEAIDKAAAAAVDEEPGRDRVGGVAEAAEDFRPTVDAIGEGRAEVDAEVGIMFGDGGAVALAGEDIGAGDENAKRGGVAGGEGHAVSLEHGLDGFRVALGHPATGGVLIHNKEVAVAILAAQEDDGVVSEAVVEGSVPGDRTIRIEVVEDMGFPAEGGEELAGGDVPIAIAPGALLPTSEAFEDLAVLRVGEGVVVDGGGDENGVGVAVPVGGEGIQAS